MMPAALESFHTSIIILEYLKALIWPIFIGTIILCFRKEIRDHWQRVTKAEFPGGLSLSFQEKLESAQQTSQLVEEQQATSSDDRPLIPMTEANKRMIELDLDPSPSGLDFDKYRSIAKDDTSLALAGLRIEVELMLNNVKTGFNIPSKNYSISMVAKDLYAAGAITHSQWELLIQIIQLCNKAIHGYRPTYKEANMVIDLADELREQYIRFLSWGFPKT